MRSLYGDCVQVCVVSNQVTVNMTKSVVVGECRLVCRLRCVFGNVVGG